MIAYLDSPFQLLQYIELEKSGHSSNKVFVRLNGKENNDSQLLHLLSYFDVKNVRTVKVISLWEKIYYYSFLLFLSLYSCTVIIGDPNCALFRLLSKFNRKSKFLLLDDGVATLSNHEINKKYTRFTMFSKYVKQSKPNDFKYLSELFSRVSDCDKKDILIGAKFVDVGICSRDTYSKALLSMLGEKSKETFLYVPHRDESEQEVNFIRDELGFQILRLELPIELILIEKGIYPKSISHVLSTAVFSMRYIYDAPINTVRISSEKLIERKTAIEGMYKILEEENISTFID